MDIDLGFLSKTAIVVITICSVVGHFFSYYESAKSKEELFVLVVSSISELFAISYFLFEFVTNERHDSKIKIVTDNRKIEVNDMYTKLNGMYEKLRYDLENRKIEVNDMYSRLRCDLYIYIEKERDNKITVLSAIKEIDSSLAHLMEEPQVIKSEFNIIRQQLDALITVK